MPAEIRRDDCTDIKRMLWTNIALGVCVGLGGDGWRQAPVALKPHHPPNYSTARNQLDIKQQDRFAGVAASPTRYAFFAYGC